MYEEQYIIICFGRNINYFNIVLNLPVFLFLDSFSPVLNIFKTGETRYMLRHNYIFMYFMHLFNINKCIIQWVYFYQALPGRGQKYPKSLQLNKIYKQMKTNHLNLNAGEGEDI